MRWSWVDWARRELNVPPEFRKGAAERVAPVPLNVVALAILEHRRDHREKLTQGRRKTARTDPDDRVWLQVKHDAARNAAALRAGLGHVRTHDLRHTFGSLAHASGASLPEVRDLLGHTTLAMVSRYAHSYGERLQEVAARVQVGATVCGVSVRGKGQIVPDKGEFRHSEKTQDKSKRRVITR